MTPWCDDVVCSWRRLPANRHSLPFPWTLSLHRQWCPSASHRPVRFLFLPALTFPLYFPFLSLGPFPSIGRGAHRPKGGGGPGTSTQHFRSPLLPSPLTPWTSMSSLFSLDLVEMTQRLLNVGQSHPDRHPQTRPSGFRAAQKSQGAATRSCDSHPCPPPQYGGRSSIPNASTHWGSSDIRPDNEAMASGKAQRPEAVPLSQPGRLGKQTMRQ